MIGRPLTLDAGRGSAFFLLKPFASGDAGNISLLRDDDDEDDDEEGGGGDRCERSSALAVCRLRFPLNVRWPGTRIASRKTAHDENTSSGPRAAFCSGDDGDGYCHWISETCWEGGMMCACGASPTITPGTPCAPLGRLVAVEQSAAEQQQVPHGGEEAASCPLTSAPSTETPTTSPGAPTSVCTTTEHNTHGGEAGSARRKERALEASTYLDAYLYPLHKVPANSDGIAVSIRLCVFHLILTGAAGCVLAAFQPEGESDPRSHATYPNPGL
ncbi:hypothetical protein EYF80_032754 [Liparis tanakae]|uniref:Uncharacterized protein n=1 Tax=Liparis tanakae TaxID=230148 RepID=A0A4Z2GW87_9TELE|nr:hypothetical protein EYF80_032754 [Liparis tanakae]